MKESDQGMVKAIWADYPRDLFKLSQQYLIKAHESHERNILM